MTTVRQVSDEAFLFQLSQGLTDRSATDSQFDRQLHLIDHHSWSQPSPEDRLADAVNRFHGQRSRHQLSRNRLPARYLPHCLHLPPPSSSRPGLRQPNPAQPIVELPRSFPANERRRAGGPEIQLEMLLTVDSLPV